MQYRLAPHTHVCVTPHGAIFLDLERDAYVAIGSVQARALGSLVEGWPRESHSTLSLGSSGDALADKLSTRGLLVPSTNPGHTAEPPELCATQEELVRWERMQS